MVFFGAKTTPKMCHTSSQELRTRDRQWQDGSGDLCAI